MNFLCVHYYFVKLRYRTLGSYQILKADKSFFTAAETVEKKNL